MIHIATLAKLLSFVNKYAWTVGISEKKLKFRLIPSKTYLIERTMQPLEILCHNSFELVPAPVDKWEIHILSFQRPIKVFIITPRLWLFYL